MISIQQLHPDSAPAREVMRAYLEDVAGSYQGRRLTASELEAVVRSFPTTTWRRRTGPCSSP